VKGLILSGTCGCGKDIDAEGQAVIGKMPDPTVVWDLKGGHLAMMTSLTEYAFTRERN
jgi:hypothetical protein